MTYYPETHFSETNPAQPEGNIRLPKAGCRHSTRYRYQLLVSTHTSTSATYYLRAAHMYIPIIPSCTLMLASSLVTCFDPHNLLFVEKWPSRIVEVDKHFLSLAVKRRSSIS